MTNNKSKSVLKGKNGEKASRPNALSTTARHTNAASSATASTRKKSIPSSKSNGIDLPRGFDAATLADEFDPSKFTGLTIAEIAKLIPDSPRCRFGHRSKQDPLSEEEVSSLYRWWILSAFQAVPTVEEAFLLSALMIETMHQRPSKIIEGIKNRKSHRSIAVLESKRRPYVPDHSISRQINSAEFGPVVNAIRRLAPGLKGSKLQQRLVDSQLFWLMRALQAAGKLSPADSNDPAHAIYVGSWDDRSDESTVEIGAETADRAQSGPVDVDFMECDILRWLEESDGREWPCSCGRHADDSSNSIPM